MVQDNTVTGAITEESVAFLLENKLEILSEQQLEFLVESRIDFIKTANKDKINTDHDPESAKMSSDAIVDHIASKIDTSKNKANTQWLVNRYKAGDFKLGHGKDIKKTMTSYEASKDFLENKDIGSYKSISHLKDALVPVQSEIKSFSERNAEAKRVDMPVVFDDGSNNIGYKVPSRQTSINNYGPSGKLAHTNWCTAANSSSNMFNGYKGGKYTLHLNNGHILQAHFQSNQLKDINNSSIDLNKDSRFSSHKDTINDFLSKTHEAEGSPTTTIINKPSISSAKFDEMLQSHKSLMDSVKLDSNGHVPYNQAHRLQDSTLNIANSIKDADISDHQFNELKSFHGIHRTSNYDYVTSHSTLQHHILNNKFANPSHIHEVAKDINFNELTYDNREALAKIAKHPNTSSETHHAMIDAALSSPNSDFIKDYASNVSLYGSNVLPEHLAKIDHLHGLKHNAIMNSSGAVVPEQYFHDLKGSSDAHVAISSHHKIPESVADHVLQTTDDKHTLNNLAVNHAVPEHIAGLAIEKSKYVNLTDYINRPTVDERSISSVASRVIDGQITSSSNTWLQSRKLPRHIVEHAINSNAIKSTVSEYGNSITNNPKIKSADLEKLIDNPHYNSKTGGHTNAVLKSHAINSKVIDKLFEHNHINSAATSTLLDEVDPTHITHDHIHKILDSNVNLNLKHRILVDHSKVQLSHFNKVKGDNRFHGAISNSKNAPPSILHELSSSPMEHVRLNVAKNPNTENRTLQALKTDASPEVSQVAIKKAK
jgi:hypothetical protein